MRVCTTAAAAAFLLATPAADAKTLLKGTVGPGFTITLKTASGKRVTTLKPGVYAISVVDSSSIHNFRLKGPGVNVAITSVAFVGTKTVGVTLRKGTYTYQCDPHRSFMRAT